MRAPGRLDGYTREPAGAHVAAYEVEENTSTELEDIHSTLTEILSTLKSKTDFSGLFLFALFLLFLDGWSGSTLDRWTDKVWYSARYGADFKNIDMQKRPSDCDFFHAPVGNKACDYKKATNIFGDEQRNALVQQATTDEERKAYEQQPNSVTVYWEKEPELRRSGHLFS